MEEKGAPASDQAGHQGLGISRRRPPKPSGAGVPLTGWGRRWGCRPGASQVLSVLVSSVWSVDLKPWLPILLGQGRLTL